jgi:hypothetical protein
MTAGIERKGGSVIQGFTLPPLMRLLRGYQKSTIAGAAALNPYVDKAIFNQLGRPN